MTRLRSGTGSSELDDPRQAGQAAAVARLQALILIRADPLPFGPGELQLLRSVASRLQSVPLAGKLLPVNELAAWPAALRGEPFSHADLDDGTATVTHPPAPWVRNPAALGGDQHQVADWIEAPRTSLPVLTGQFLTAGDDLEDIAAELGVVERGKFVAATGEGVAEGLRERVVEEGLAADQFLPLIDQD